MKNHLFYFGVATAFLIVPFVALSFSFGNVVNFGKKLMRVENRVESQANQYEAKKEVADESAQISPDEAVQKFENWKNAFARKNIGQADCVSHNFHFTETEFNYFIVHELAGVANPQVRDPQISFERDLAKISGYSLFKKFPGQFYLEVKVIQRNGRLNLKVAKAKYRKIYVFPFIAEPMLNSQAKDTMNFLYSNPDCQNPKVTIGDGFAELNYGN